MSFEQSPSGRYLLCEGINSRIARTRWLVRDSRPDSWYFTENLLEASIWSEEEVRTRRFGYVYIIPLEEKLDRIRGLANRLNPELITAAANVAEEELLRLRRG